MAQHSIVIPVFNEISGIETLFQRLVSVIESIKEPCEVILINDGSRDGSDQLLDELTKKDSRFKIIHFSRNFGHQIAITAGIAHSTGDTVTVMDADLQDPPEVIIEFIKKWNEGFEVVYGVRKMRKGESIFKLWTAKIFYRLIQKITDIEIPVDAGDFRLMDRKVVDAFLRIGERNRYVRGLVSWLGYKQIGVFYDRDMRKHGSSHYPLNDMLKLAFGGIASFSFLPLRLATWMGFAIASLASIGILITLYLRWFTERTIQGWSSILVTVLFMGGVQLIFLGIFGSYLGRMFDEVRGRPLYLVSRKTGF